MKITPDLDTFLELAGHRRIISVYARVVADDLTPVGLYHHLCGTRPGTFLFESADNGVWSRYSFIGVENAAMMSVEDGQAVWSGDEIAGLPRGGDPLQVLRETLSLLHTDRDPDLPPLTSGMVGFLGYDVVRRLERLPDTTVNDLGLPELGLMLVRDMAVIDHHRAEVWLISNAINYDDSRIAPRRPMLPPLSASRTWWLAWRHPPNPSWLFEKTNRT